jgi:hypothetical protein
MKTFNADKTLERLWWGLDTWENVSKKAPMTFEFVEDNLDNLVWDLLVKNKNLKFSPYEWKRLLVARKDDPSENLLFPSPHIEHC